MRGADIGSQLQRENECCGPIPRPKVGGEVHFSVQSEVTITQQLLQPTQCTVLEHTHAHTGSACKVHITTDTLLSLVFCVSYKQPSASPTKVSLHLIIIKATRGVTVKVNELVFREKKEEGMKGHRGKKRSKVKKQIKDDRKRRKTRM